jgi:hypothetical protein
VFDEAGPGAAGHDRCRTRRFLSTQPASQIFDVLTEVLTESETDKIRGVRATFKIKGNVTREDHVIHFVIRVVQLLPSTPSVGVVNLIETRKTEGSTPPFTKFYQSLISNESVKALIVPKPE